MSRLVAGHGAAMTGPTPAQRAAQIKLDLEALYRAGKVDFPDKAEELSGYATVLGHQMDEAGTQAAKAADVTSLIFDDLAATSYLLHEALRRAVVTMNDCASGCIEVANMFAHTDEQAADAQSALARELPGIAGTGGAPQAPEPPARTDPTT